ncbi:IS3 family transposase [Siphonobacter aquaeclarae]|uniref:IS3 family transposase n=1 Tax=Siphonobacter aquaeclarae TaxID=563176 RepID=UPI00373FD5A5
MKKELKQLYHRHKGRLGYRRLTLALRKTGTIINHKTVFRLLKSLGLRSLIRVRKYRSYKGGNRPGCRQCPGPELSL